MGTMSEERREEAEELQERVRDAIRAYVRVLPPRYALSGLLRLIWSQPEFVQLRKRLSESAKELRAEYASVAKEVNLSKRYSEAAERVGYAKRAREAWAGAR